MRVAVPALTAGALALALALALWWRPRPESRTLPASPRNAAAVAERPDAPPSAPVSPPVPAPAAAQPSAPAAPSEPEAPPPAAPFAVPPLAQHYADMYASRFEGDAPDPDPSLARMLSARLSGFIPAGSRADPVECHRALCRVQTFHPDRASYDAYVEKAFLASDPNARLWPGQTWIAVPPDRSDGPPGERVVSSIYLERAAEDEK